MFLMSAGTYSSISPSDVLDMVELEYMKRTSSTVSFESGSTEVIRLSISVRMRRVRKVTKLNPRT